MGSWSAGVWGNDTAEDLKFEYQCAFYRYDPEEAVRRLDEYVRTSIGDESDTIEWCNYIYSLADFMWKKGILTEAVKTAAVSMIDSGFGLDEWEKSGQAAEGAGRAPHAAPVPAAGAKADPAENSQIGRAFYRRRLYCCPADDKGQTV